MSTAPSTEVPQFAHLPISQRKCNHDYQFIVLPPSIEFMTQNFPNISPNLLLDHSIPRCKLCDLSDAQEMFELLRMPDEAYRNIAPNMFNYIKGKIKSTEYWFSTGVRKEETEKALVEWKQKRADAISAKKSIENTWNECWSIWGLAELHIEIPSEASANGEVKVEELAKEVVNVETPPSSEESKDLGRTSKVADNYGGEDEIEW